MLDLKTKKFRKRTHKDHITKFLHWDYTGERDADKMRHVVGVYKKLQANPVMATFAVQWQAKMLDLSRARNMTVPTVIDQTGETYKNNRRTTVTSATRSSR